MTKKHLSVRFNKLIDIITKTVYTDINNENSLNHHAIKKLEAQCSKIINKRNSRKINRRRKIYKPLSNSLLSKLQNLNI